MSTYLIGYRHYPVSVAKFFVRGFRQLGHRVLTVGPFTEELPWAPEGDFSEEVEVPDIPLDWQVEKFNVNQLLGMMPKVSAVVSFDAGFRLTGTLNNAPTILYGTDPHVKHYNYRNDYDYFFSAQHGHGIWVPLGYDPEYHRFCEEITAEARPIDVGFVGQIDRPGYSNRQAVRDALECTGMNNLFTTGLVGESYRWVYNHSKISFNWSSSWDIPMRLWEGMAMGCCTLTNRLPHLEDLGFVEGKDYLAFSNTVEDAVTTASQALKSGLWEEIAKHGKESVRRHTYANRVQDLIRNCN